MEEWLLYNIVYARPYFFVHTCTVQFLYKYDLFKYLYIDITCTNNLITDFYIPSL